MFVQNHNLQNNHLTMHGIETNC